MLRRRGWIASILLALSVALAPAHAEVTVSITITGNIDELIPILQKLQELGLGGATASTDPLQLNVHSVMTAEQAAQPVPAAPPTLPAQPAFSQAAIEPAAAKPGTEVLVTATVADPARAIDTVAASIGETRVDLFDNGTEGDATAADGIWSRKTVLPATLAAGETAITVHAYNASGEPVTVPGPNNEPTPLTTQAKVTVTP